MFINIIYIFNIYKYYKKNFFFFISIFKLKETKKI